MASGTGLAEMVRAVRFAHDVGCGGVSIFQRANLRRCPAAVVLDDPRDVPPEPHPHRDEILASVDAIRGEADWIAALIGERC